MNCESLDNLLLDLLYDEVEGDEKVEANAHLDGCEGCQKKYAGMGGVRAAFRAMPEPVMPVLSYQALLAEAAIAAKAYAAPLETPKKVEEKEGIWAKITAGMRFLLSPPVAVAAGVVLVLGVSLSINGNQKSVPTMSQEAMAPAPSVVNTPMAMPSSAAIAPAVPVEFDDPSKGPTQEKLTAVTEKPAEAIAADPRGKMAAQTADKKAPAKEAKPTGDSLLENDADGFGSLTPATAVPGVASAEPFTAQTTALAKEGKCSDAEKTARAISAGSESWCQNMQVSAKCFEQNKQNEQTIALYNEMKSFDACAAEAEKALVAFNKSQVGGKGKTTQSAIRSEFKKKSKPESAPKTDPDSSLNPSKSSPKNTTQAF